MHPLRLMLPALLVLLAPSVPANEVGDALAVRAVRLSDGAAFSGFVWPPQEAGDELHYWIWEVRGDEQAWGRDPVETWWAVTHGLDATVRIEQWRAPDGDVLRATWVRGADDVLVPAAGAGTWDGFVFALGPETSEAGGPARAPGEERQGTQTRGSFSDNDSPLSRHPTTHRGLASANRLVSGSLS